MRFTSIAALFTLSTLTYLSINTSHRGGAGCSLVEAALTPEERAQVEAQTPENPNYCPVCLKKAMANHFPHACPSKLAPLEGTERPLGPLPEEHRCICVAFMDLYWMRLDCELECPFVKDEGSMKQFVHSSKVPGCDKFIDFVTGEEKVPEGQKARDPNHVPVVFEHTIGKEDEEEAKVEEKKGEEPVEVEAQFEEAEAQAKVEAEASEDVEEVPEPEVQEARVVDEDVKVEVAKEEEEEAQAGSNARDEL